MKNSFLLATLAMLISFVPLANGQNGSNASGPITHTYALTNVNIVPQPGELIEMGVIIIKDGLIHALGKNVSIPANAKVLDADSMFVYAGFIDALSHVGVPKPASEEEQNRLRNVDRGNPPNELAGIQPEQKVSTLLSAKEKSIGEMRQLGFTTAHVVPQGRMFPGQGAIILLGGDNSNEMIVRDQTSIFSQLRTARGVFPATVIGIISKWKELYKQAQQAQAHETLYRINPKGMSRPEYDPSLQALYPVLDGELPVFFMASDAKSIHRVLKLQEELSFPLVLSGVKEGWHSANVLKSRKIPVLLSMDLPKEPKKEEKKDSDEKEEKKEMSIAEKEKEQLEKRRAVTMEKHLKQAAVMQQKGIDFAFSTMNAKSKEIKDNLRRMIENGLSEKQALAALTTLPARMLGLSSLMGTVEEGKIANLVVSTGPYFEEESGVRYVFVDGALFEYEVKKKKKKAEGDPTVAINPAGTWSYNIEVPGQEASGNMTISIDGSDYSGSMSFSMADEPLTLSNFEISGNQLNFDATLEADGQTVTLSFDLVVDGDTFEGSVDAGQFGTFDVEGDRTSGPEN